MQEALNCGVPALAGLCPSGLKARGDCGLGEWLSRVLGPLPGDALAGEAPGPAGGVNGRTPSVPRALGEELFLLAALMMFLASRACICRLALGSGSCRSGERDRSLQDGDMGGGGLLTPAAGQASTGPSSGSGVRAGLNQPSKGLGRDPRRGVQGREAGRDTLLSWGSMPAFRVE